MNAFVSPLGGARRQMPVPSSSEATVAGPNMARQNSFAAKLPAPAQAVGGAMQNAFASKAAAPMPMMSPAQNPFAISQPASPGPLANAFKGFATGLLGVDKVNAMDDRYKAQDMEESKKKLAMLQQFRAMPVEQRMAALPQLSQAIGKEVPQEVMSDQAIDAQLAMMQGQLGIAPATPEYLNLGGGAVGKVANGQFSMAHEAPTEPAKPTIVNNRVIDPNDPTKVIADYSDPTKPPSLPEGMWYGPDGKGQPQPIPGYEGMRGRIAAAGRAPSDGQDTYRPATAEDRARWGLPPEGAFKINQRTGEPAAISGARAASDYSPTEVRGFRDKADGLLILQNAVQKYVSTLEEMGGPQLLDTPLNAENSQALKTAHALITSAIKQADTLGALDQGVKDLVAAVIPDPVGWSTWGKSTDSIKKGAEQLYESIEFKQSRIPEEYRFGSTGAAPPEQLTPQYTPKEVTQAKLALQNWDYLPASMRTPQARALAEKVAGVAKPTAADASDDDILSALGLK